MQATIFVLDDDKNITEILALYFKKEGYNVKEFWEGESLLNALSLETPDIIIMDIMMPKMDGYDVLKELRKVSKVPVIMLSAKGETLDKVLGLELGADDYIVKPFEPKEVLARVKAIMRRTEEKQDDKILKFDNLIINIDEFTVKYHDEFMALPPKEMELLYFFAKNKNKVFTREQLLSKIWGIDYYGDTRTVDVHVKRLRDKFDKKDSWKIKTVWGVGYKFSM
ncbi:MAG: response regulator transcription factor [Bacillota bacterium]|nr:response regulator transcription factor [Bacillota bacterium]